MISPGEILSRSERERTGGSGGEAPPFGLVGRGGGGSVAGAIVVCALLGFDTENWLISLMWRDCIMVKFVRKISSK